MSQELSALNIEEDFQQLAECDDMARWTVEKPDPLEILATMSPRGTPSESFQARLLWSDYPDRPPSLKFRDPGTGRLDLPAAWPVVRGFRPNTLDACVNWCEEGFNLHPEWRNDAKLRWDPRGNVLLKVLRILQEELDEFYQGRYNG